MTSDSHKIDHFNYSVKRISAEETYAVRQSILRAGRPIDDCVFEGDTLESTFHLGLYFKASLIGVATYIKNKNAVFPEESQYQLRGMAILKKHQKKGLGTLLIQAGEAELLKMKVDRLWFNAREVATKFYTNHGYKIQGDSFNIESIGIHFLMTNK
ncbi:MULTISPECIES: GNAT family N-acetyltransferase [Bizionia]|uniref:GNAT family N-acetyltransferase n=1 Tax=Bizionia algoritergicola TaxID=291187 RepID=A0A5D0QUV3_9FLAO|nr:MULTISPECIES: GNAT family N-acetyltransferase [Bizionia]OBX21410.1 acetyltransferase [Bizionia sp. APA-3]TYB72950.1 GNAT family N-acetyltransferase [Bizionia algoritergicola]